MPLFSVNPTTGETLAEYREFSPSQIQTSIVRADRAFHAWKTTTLEHRTALLSRVAAVLRDKAEEYAALMTREMGKPIAQARAEVSKCAWVCDYYSENAAGFLAPDTISTDASYSGVVYRPLGVILAVMPWNFPFWQVFRFAAPALAGGNTALLKHASNVCGCALAIEEAFRLAGFPEGVFQTLLIPGSGVEPVIRHPRVMGVSLTGSTPAGRAVASVAGSELKRCVLELGGSDPYVVLPDADIDLAVEACATGRMLNTGQSCIAAKRFIVVESVADTFTQKMLVRLQKEVMGDPMLTATTVGPMAREDLRAELHAQVTRSLEQGARLLLGGSLPTGKGCYYPPTLLDNVRPGMPAFDEELFGPVGVIVHGVDETHALTLAGQTDFGLGAAVFTRDFQHGLRIAADELEAGCCFVNGFVKSDPRLPFGGIKQSGFGRELGLQGIRQFMNVKTVWGKGE